ncbi:MAG: hypothetical protein AB8B81_17960 [Halioglobus sp.]
MSNKKAHEKSINSNKAIRATELNAAISALWAAQATHTKEAFENEIVPIYENVYTQLIKHLPQDEAEDTLLNLINNTMKACHYRWTVRLPMKRPGTDYRRYEILYTYALVTAMAVESVIHLDPNNTDSPEKTAIHLLPTRGLDNLRAEALVLEDWLGFFENAEVGGLYAVSRGRSLQVENASAVKKLQSIVSHTGEKPAGKECRVEGQHHSQTSRQVGLVMLNTMKQQLADGLLTYNNPGDLVQVDRGGRTFLEYPGILEWYTEQAPPNLDLTKAKKSLESTGVCKRSNKGHNLYRGRLRARDARLRGYVVEDTSSLWQNDAPIGRFVIENLTALK